MDKWYDAKMRYTRSVAVNSVVGHILGIGDRHCKNILIHQGTGEVVYIDFGIVFEQGKVSPLSCRPETKYSFTHDVYYISSIQALDTTGDNPREAEAS
jgi:hypothetical protein